MAKIIQLLPWRSWLEREAVNLKVGSSSFPGRVFAEASPVWKSSILSGYGASDHGTPSLSWNLARPNMSRGPVDMARPHGARDCRLESRVLPGSCLAAQLKQPATRVCTNSQEGIYLVGFCDVAMQ